MLHYKKPIIKKWAFYFSQSRTEISVVQFIAHLCGLKYAQDYVAINPNSQPLVNRAPCLDLFSSAQQDHKLNQNDIISALVCYCPIKRGYNSVGSNYFR